MAHQIHLETNISQVVNKDVTIVVKTGKKAKMNKLGSLLISKGNVEWIPAGNFANKYRVSWTDLAKLIADKGKKVKM